MTNKLNIHSLNRELKNLEDDMTELYSLKIQNIIEIDKRIESVQALIKAVKEDINKIYYEGNGNINEEGKEKS